MRHPFLLVTLLAVPVLPLPAQDTRPEFVVVTFGDSYSSGEGAPEIHGAHTLAREIAAERWDDTADAAAAREAWRCHRSPRAASAVAAQQLRERFPELRVTFVSFACSGAEIVRGVLGPYTGIDPAFRQDTLLSPQIEQANAWLRTRPAPRIDALVLGIGGNDLGFGSIVIHCLFVPNLVTVAGTLGCESNPRVHQLLRDGVDSLTRPGARYARLNAAVNGQAADGSPNLAVAPARVYAMGYPNPSRAGMPTPQNPANPQNYCDGRGGDEPLYWTATRAEARYIEQQVVGGLNEAVRASGAAMQPRPWRVVTEHATDFRPHGLCSGDRWFRGNLEAIRIQGADLPPGLQLPPHSDGTPVVLNVPLSSAVVHPNEAGHRAMGLRLAAALEEQVRERFALDRQPRLAVDSTIAAMRTTAAGREALRPGTARTAARVGGAGALSGRVVFSWTAPQADATGHWLLAVDGREIRLPAGTTRYTLRGSGRFEARVRACGPVGCSPQSNLVTVSNVVPGVPTGLRRAGAPGAPGAPQPGAPQWAGVVQLSWTAADRHHEYFEVHRRQIGGSSALQPAVVRPGGELAVAPAGRAAAPAGAGFQVQRTTQTEYRIGSPSQPVASGSRWEVKVRACSAVGCSEFTPVLAAGPGSGPAPAR